MANDISVVYSLKDNFSNSLKNISSNQQKFKKDLENTSKELAVLYDKKRQLQVDNKAADKAIKDTMKNAEKFGNEYEKIMQENAKKKLEIQLQTQEVNKRIKETQNNLSTLDTKKAKPEVVLKDNLTKGLNTIKQKLDQTVKDKYGISISAKIQSAISGLTTVKNRVFAVGKLAASPIIKVVDMATKGIKSIMGMLSKLAKPVTIAVALAGAGLGEALKQGSELETQRISMAHFIGIQNKGMSTDQVAKVRDDYITQLRNNANTTPFKDADVVSAGSRAVNLAQGDTKKAMDYVQLAENMTALNPQQSLDSAMQALLDAKEGNTRMLRDFGFNIPEEQVKKAGGIDNIFDKQLKPFFAGGAKELSSSSTGIMSTIKGKLGNQVQDFGFKALEKVKPLLQGTLDLITRMSPTMDRMGTAMANGIGKGIEVIGNLKKHFSDFKPVIDIFSKAFEYAVPIVNGAIKIFEGAVQNGMPIVKQIFTDVGQSVLGVLKWISDHMTQVQQIFAWAWPLISSVIKTAWDIAKPIMDIIIDTFKIIGDIVLQVAPVVEGAISGMWDVVQPILEAFAGALQTVSDTIKWISDHTGDIQKAGSSINNGANNTQGMFGFSRAMGVTRVPYDGYPIVAHEGEQLLTKQEANNYKNGNGVLVQKLADTIVVREDADIDKIANALVKKIKLAGMNT
jgi:hypothetical protein